MSDQPKPSPLGGGLDNIIGRANKLMTEINPEFDQIKAGVKADLDNLQKKTGSELAANLYKDAEKGFKKDLEELGITEQKDQKKYLDQFESEWKKEQMDSKAKAIVESPELGKMDDFIGNLKNLTGLQKIIESTEPRTQLQNMFLSLCQRAGMDEKMVRVFLVKAAIPEWAMGFLIPEKKKDDTQAAALATTDSTIGKGDKGGDKGKDDSEKGGDKKAKTGKEAKEVKEVKSTVFIGDSITASLNSLSKSNDLNIKGGKKILAEESQTVSWGREQIEKTDFKGVENAVFNMGINNLNGGSPEALFEEIKTCYVLLKSKGVKNIYGVTLSPGKGNPMWKNNFSKIEKQRIGVNELIRKCPLLHGFMDPAARKSDGGFANDNDPEELSEDMRAKKTDYVHPKAAALARMYQLKLEEGSA